MSDYDDPFVVVLDERTGDESRLDPSVFASLVDECQTRVIVVRPVDDIMEVALALPGDAAPRTPCSPSAWRSARPGEGLTKAVPRFRHRVRQPGRDLHPHRRAGGRSPDSAYSWDGLLPLDLVGTRPPGYFTTIEFDSPFDEMMQTYRAHLARLAKIPPVAGRA